MIRVWGWKNWDLDPTKGKRFPSAHNMQTGSETTQPSTEWAPWVLLLGVLQLGHENTHLNLVPRLRKSGALLTDTT